MDKKLGIYIITHNRAALLGRTLDFLAASALRDYAITVLDNASTDATAAVVEAKAAGLPGLRRIRNHVNIGPNANFLRAFDYSDTEYTWVLCDDDILELSELDDVLRVIGAGQVELLHVGAHRQEVWRAGGECCTPQALLARGYAYFKFASFIPCNIIKTSTFVGGYLVAGYNNVGNAYPHMPFAFGLYLAGSPVYVARRQLVFAQAGQHYAVDKWFGWWMKTCELLVQPPLVRAAYLNQWRDNGISSDELGLKSLLYAQKITTDARDARYVNAFIRRYFTLPDRLRLLAYRLRHVGIRNRFGWLRPRRQAAAT